MRRTVCLAILAAVTAAAAPATQPDGAVADVTPAPAVPALTDAGPSTRPNVKPLPADEMLSQMLRPTAPERAAPLRPQPGPPANDAKSGGGALAPNAPTVSLLREGTDVINRVGRLQRGPDGQQQEVIFDSDGKTMRDPPMVVLPNLKLMSMETAVNQANHDLRFRITGTVTEYRGRNYILLDKVVVVDDKNQEF